MGSEMNFGDTPKPESIICGRPRVEEPGDAATQNLVVSVLKRLWAASIWRFRRFGSPRVPAAPLDVPAGGAARRRLVNRAVCR